VLGELEGAGAGEHAAGDQPWVRGQPRRAVDDVVEDGVADERCPAEHRPDQRVAAEEGGHCGPRTVLSAGGPRPPL